MTRRILLIALLCSAILGSIPAAAQPLKTPLSQDILTLLTNEISGQVIFNNEVLLAGAPWIRGREEFTDTFYESQGIYDLARNYGIGTIELARHSSDRTFDYPFDAKFTLIEPEERVIARLAADPALVASGSRSADVTGELIYIPPPTQEDIQAMLDGRKRTEYSGKVALMWSHASGRTAEALDASGIQAVISFSSRDRYFDPHQVVYSRGSYANGDNLKLGFTVSWKQWSELMEDVERGLKPVVNCSARIETFPDKFETVFSWIPGTEPEEKGVIFTAHLFEGYTKRGANDNMSGCVIQLEILRALTSLIENGDLPQPRRTIYFLWPNEISGTYEFIKQNPGFADKLSININMDMCGEGLRINNSWFTMSECPNHLPSYLDGLTYSIMNYVWRTNDIVYLPDSPRGRPGGQNFPIPMMEKNGSIDAFRFFVHRATGGSDHLCFNNPSVAVPGIEFFTWPDYWYHADTDTPDKSDPTQMKRVAFIGAASAYAAANCSDEVLPGMLDAVSAFGYNRVAEREHPAALQMIENATPANMQDMTDRALNLVSFAADREIGALASIEKMYTGTEFAKSNTENRIAQWEFHRESISDQVLRYAELKAKAIGAKKPNASSYSSAEKKYDSVVPAIHPAKKGSEFSLTRTAELQNYIRNNPDEMESVGLNRVQTNALLNYINGERSVTTIARYTSAETGTAVDVEAVKRYIDVLQKAGVVVIQ